MDPERLELFKRTSYWQEMNAIVQQCFAIAERKGLNLTQLAELADLSPNTIRRNVDQQVGLRQELTLWKLCAAVNLRIQPSGANKSGRSIGGEMVDIRKALDRPARKKRSKKARGGGRKKKAKKKSKS